MERMVLGERAARSIRSCKGRVILFHQPRIKREPGLVRAPCIGLGVNWNEAFRVKVARLTGAAPA